MVDRSPKTSHVEALLSVADDLCRSHGPKHVRQAAFRRAISTAYYAVFHGICSACTDGLIGWNSPDLMTEVYRALDHAGARRKLLGAAPMAIHPDLAKVGALFAMLQENRHSADYSPLSLIVMQAEALASVAHARDAMATINALDAIARKRLAVLLLVARRPS